MKILNTLERRLYKYTIRPFYQYIIFSMVGVYLIDLFFPFIRLSQHLMLIRNNIFRGEIWRLATFLIVPPAGRPFQTFLSLYFYYFIGTALESQWGPRRFLMYYAIGAIGTILGALLVGYGVNHYLNMSLFFAFALTYPNYEILLFFIIPIKMKWIALFNAAFFILSLLVRSWNEKLSIVISLANLFLFFGGDILNTTRLSITQWKRRKQFKDIFK